MDYQYFLYIYSDYIYPYIGIGFLAALAIFMLLIVCWVLKGIGLCRIAKCRGVKNFAMSFVPVGSSWLLGVIVDKYDAEKKGHQLNLRKYILLSGLISVGAGIISTVAFVCMFYYRYMTMSMAGLTAQECMSSLLTVVAVYYIALALIELVYLAYKVLYYIALGRLYRSVNRKAWVGLLVLSILISPSAPVTLLCMGANMDPTRSGRRKH